MIHHTPEATVIKLGLNYKRSKGGFCLLWAWYDFAKHEAFTARLRFRWHIRPWFLWSVERSNVIQNYMEVRGLTMVHQEILEDLNAMESDYKRRSDSVTLVKP